MQQRDKKIVCFETIRMEMPSENEFLSNLSICPSCFFSCEIHETKNIDNEREFIEHDSSLTEILSILMHFKRFKWQQKQNCNHQSAKLIYYFSFKSIPNWFDGGRIKQSTWTFSNCFFKWYHPIIDSSVVCLRNYRLEFILNSIYKQSIPNFDSRISSCNSMLVHFTRVN